MTMQTSGPISMLEAMNECKIGAPSDLLKTNGPVSLSSLAGVGGGQRMAWSYWYGKSALPVIQNVLFAQYHVYVDRDAYESIDFRTGANSAYGFNGNGGPGLRSYSPQRDPIGDQISSYSSWSCSVAKVSGRSNVTIQQQPAPGNDWTTIIYVDDNPWSGQTDVTVNVYITCNP
jgi:hypothetical protein